MNTFYPNLRLSLQSSQGLRSGGRTGRSHVEYTWVVNVDKVDDDDDDDDDGGRKAWENLNSHILSQMTNQFHPSDTMDFFNWVSTGNNFKSRYVRDLSVTQI